MNKRQLPEHMRDLSGIALKNAMIAHKKKEIVKLVCRQTDYTEEVAQTLLEGNKYNYMKIIKEWINLPSNKEDTEDKPAKSLLSASALALSKFNCLPVSNSASISA